MADVMILGENCVYSTDSEKTGLNNNVLVVGSSGSGKTMSISEPLLLKTFHRSLVVSVTKRRIVQQYTPLLRRRGYEVLDLDFVRPERGNIGYDPLQFIASYQDITFLAESIVKSDPRKTRSVADPFWDAAAVSRLSAEISYTLTTKGTEATLVDVLELHDRLSIQESFSDEIETTLDNEFLMLAEQDPACFAVTCWKSFRSNPPKTARCIYSELNVTLDNIFSEEIRQLIVRPVFVDLESIATRKTVLFITSSPVNPSLHFFINMFYGHVFKQLFEFAEDQPEGTLPVPVHVLCDDFATGCCIRNFPQYISIFREKKISVTLLLQSESQLASMYGDDDAVTIINGCDSYVFLGGMDILTAKNVSIRLDRPLDEVLCFPVGREIIFRRGQRPVVTGRYEIRKDEVYQQMIRDYERRKTRRISRFH